MTRPPSQLRVVTWHEVIGEPMLGVVIWERIGRPARTAARRPAVMALALAWHLNEQRPARV
jgi:hypothetical protein